MMRYVQIIGLLILALANYKLAKILQPYFELGLGSYPYSITVAWFGVVLVPVVLFWRDVGFVAVSRSRRDWGEVIAWSLAVLAATAAFVALGVSRYFHNIQYPIIFFLATPMIEELLFRGVIYGWIARHTKWSPVVGSAVLFGLHHLQYFDFRITLFALFQVVYTMVLGLILGRMRMISKSIYSGIVLHMLINYLTWRF